MFDATFPLAPFAPIPPAPAPLDTRAIMPMLRAQEAEIAVEVLASAVATNAVAFTRWVTLKEGLNKSIPRKVSH